MAAMKPRTGDGPMEVAKEGRGIVMRVPVDGGGRLVVEMKDRFKGMHGDLFGGDSAFTLTTPSAEPETNDAESEAVAALVSLGYKPQEASRMISKVGRPDADCETLIRDALRAAI